jgi:cystathionine beta-lyase/cystathionine gamma-synthase
LNVKSVHLLHNTKVEARGIGMYTHGVGIETHYGRMANPTCVALEKSLCALEESKYAFAFPSGTSALTACGFL